MRQTNESSARSDSVGTEGALGVAGMHAFEPLGEAMQVGIAKPLRLDFAHRGEHIVAIGARAPMTLSDEMHLRIKIEPARILRMTPIDHIDECAHAPLRLAGNEHVPPGLTVDHGDLLARAEISDGRGPRRAADPIGDAAAGATAVEAEHETGLFRRAA